MNTGAAVRRSRTKRRSGGMKLVSVVNGIERELELEAAVSGGASCAFSVDSRECVADVEQVEPGVYSILLGRRSFEVKIEEGDRRYFVAVNGHRYEILVQDPRRLARQANRLEAAGPQMLTAPMPGKVVRVMVEAGQPVAAGQGLVVVEAMKMQNEIKAPKAGSVRALHVDEGGSVGAGDALVEVE